MLPKAESACFAIADISGYTHFVSGVELDHAQDIIADIMDTLVRALRPPFRLAKFEGDAAFVTYRCVAKGGKSFRNTEFFSFEGDKIKRIDVYFGATYQDGVFVRQSES